VDLLREQGAGVAFELEGGDRLVAIAGDGVGCAAMPEACCRPRRRAIPALR
jgi:hypothetical protein